MRSHRYEPPQLVARKQKVRNETRKKVRAIIVDESKDYKVRITNAITAALMLAVNSAYHIGPKRMVVMLDSLTEWLEYFKEYMDLGIGFEVLENRLKERGLYEIYDELVIKPQKLGSKEELSNDERNT